MLYCHKKEIHFSPIKYTRKPDTIQFFLQVISQDFPYIWDLSPKGNNGIGVKIKSFQMLRILRGMKIYSFISGISAYAS